ncbi:MAG: polysaccharide deacetylase family protein [Pseudomonadota bacterium]
MSVSDAEDLSLSAYSPDRSLPAKLNRRLIQWMTVRSMQHAPKQAIVSFTFDDFPRSAADNGARIVESVGGRGTFYAATGMAGKSNVTGELFSESDISALLKAGHEIGAHTHSHLDCAKASLDTVADELKTNRDSLIEMGVSAAPAHFAYPFGETTVALKTRLDGAVSTARGILPGINRRGADLMQLRALELTPDTSTLDRAAKAIEAASRTPAWVIIFTHDVREAPSDYGVTPSGLRRLVRLASDSGASIQSIGQAYSSIGLAA